MVSVPCLCTSTTWAFQDLKPQPDTSGKHPSRALHQESGSSLGENLQQCWISTEGGMRSVRASPYPLGNVCWENGSTLCGCVADKCHLCALFSWKERKLHREASVKKENKLFPGSSRGSATDFSLETILKVVKLLFFAACDECTNKAVRLFILVFSLMNFYIYLLCASLYRQSEWITFAWEPIFFISKVVQ